jgi:hypothetical protein
MGIILLDHSPQDFIQDRIMAMLPLPKLDPLSVHEMQFIKSQVCDIYGQVIQ